MQLKLMTDYALRMLTYLSITNVVANSKTIADYLEIPQKNILSIGRKLKAANYVRIINGPYGGYEIIKKPEEILLFDIISIFEKIKVNGNPESEKQGEPHIMVNNFYMELRELIEKKLRTETLKDLIEKK